MARILIVDDEKSYRDVLKVIFGSYGHEVWTAADGRTALATIRKTPCSVVISDVRMPDMDGIELLRAVRAASPDTAVILMTAFGTIDTAREAFKLGADDFIQKPFNNDELKVIVDRALGVQEIVSQNRAFRAAQRQTGSTAKIIGRSPAIRQLIETIETVAREESTILITGESGSGKELVARAIHDLSARADKPFIPINCGAMTETLLESELFGFMKGTFTGAEQSRAGMFESADKGSIFLDEIGDMSPAMQVKILRVLQERRVRRVGASTEIPVDTRVIAATNRDIGPMVEDGRFRQDLYFRISVIPIRVPSLSERREDIPGLVEHFVRRFSERSGKRVTVCDEALGILTKRAWRGNVRELEHTVERAVAFAKDGESILAVHCMEESKSNGHKAARLPADGLDLPEYIRGIEKDLVVDALQRSSTQAEAAGLLKIPVHALRHLIEKHALK